MPTRRYVLLPAVLSLALAACGGGSHNAAPTTPPPTTAAPTSAAPTATSRPTVAPTSKPTPSPTPAPTKSGLPQATGPAPAHFSPIDFSFIGASFGWSLGQVCTDSVCTARLARTTDAGHSWHALPDPGLHTNEDSGNAVRSIRFGNQDHA